jgi:hypothetical protein
VQVTPVDPRILRINGRTVEDRLRYLLAQDVDPELVFIHRDAENQGRDVRVDEIRAGATAAGVTAERVVPVVPVRMTEAWLLLDEIAIRRAAGRPTSTNNLNMPAIGEVERMANPKERLAELLLAAGAPAGHRRRSQFERDFGAHRRLLLERLDLDGPINRLTAWRNLREDVAAALGRLDHGVSSK